MNKKKILKTFLIVLILIFLFLVIHIVRNMIIINNINKKLLSYNDYPNYHVKCYNYQGNYFILLEAYVKENNSISSVTRYGNNEITKLTKYVTKDEQRLYIDSPSDKLVSLEDTSGMLIIDAFRSYGNMYENLFIDSLFSTIISEKVNGKECYKVVHMFFPNFLYDESAKEFKYYDKETGLVIRKSNGRVTGDDNTCYDIIVDYEYELDTVKDADLIPPNMEDYELVTSQ